MQTLKIIIIIFGLSCDGNFLHDSHEILELLIFLFFGYLRFSEVVKSSDNPFFLGYAFSMVMILR